MVYDGLEPKNKRKDIKNDIQVLSMNAAADEQHHA